MPTLLFILDALLFTPAQLQLPDKDLEPGGCTGQTPVIQQPH
jgi:hypothetical protein